MGRAEAAYFQMLNARGGIRGRRITFLSVDGTSDPARASEQAHALIEQDHVLLLFGVFGTEQNLSIRGYLNDLKIPQLFASANSSALDDPAHFPWTMGFFPTARTEGLAYAKYILSTRPSGKIGLMYADTRTGREYAAGLTEGLGDKAAAMIVATQAFAPGDPKIPERVAAMRAAGADIFANFTVGKWATEAIRAAADAGWHPLQLIPNASVSIAAFLEPAGLDKAAGIIANAHSRGWLHGESAHDRDAADFLEWMRRFNPGGDLRDASNVAGYEHAEALAAVLARCGDDLTRANVMKVAASLDLELGMLAPGIRLTTSATDYQPIKQLYLIRFDGENWQGAGTVSSR
jgi:ABC-type branched-subunit amino acid transport system substrate-binding protein